MNSTEAKEVLMIVRWPVGGIRTYLKYLLKDWQGPRIRVTFLMPNGSEVKALTGDEYAVEVNWKIHDSSNPTFLEWMFYVRQTVKCQQWDLIHCQGFTSAISCSFWLTSKVKSMFTSHDVLMPAQFDGVKGAVKKRVIGWLLSRFDIVQAVSNDGMENMLEYFPSIKKAELKVILNGVDTERFYRAEPKSIRTINNIADDVKVIGFFGRFMAQKGFRYLVDALAELESQGINLVCFCYGDGAFIREEKASLRDRGLDHLFRFQGFEPDISSSVKAMDLVVMPSLWEACPLQPMEVLSAGVPFVGSSCIGLREVCADTPAFLCEPGNVESLTETIRSAISQNRRPFEEYADLARERFSKDVMQRLYEELYASVFSGRPVNAADKS